MKNILHLSDFHISANMPNPEDNMIITTLIKKIKKLDIKIDIIIYTGDLIDSKCISKKIENCPNLEKERLWNKEANNSFQLAAKYLSYIRDSFGVPNNHVIICCGNHDVNLSAEGNKKIPCHKSDILTSDERFFEFDRCCKDLHFTSFHENQWQQIDEFNFLIANSNWINKNNEGLCINCNSIESIINAHKEELQLNIKNGHIEYNIFISHSPWVDFCENCLYEYEENKYSPIMGFVRKYFGILCAGDKHSISILGSDSLVGAPLSSDKIAYGLYQFNEKEKKTIYKKIVYFKNKWEIVESSDTVNEIVKCSLDYLKDKGISILCGTENVNLCELIENLHLIKKGIKWKELNAMFNSFTNLQKPRIGESGTSILTEDNLVDQVINIINNSSTEYPIVLRGMPKLGKSFFLTIIYISMMNQWLNSSFQYIPVYFNLDACVREYSGTEDNADIFNLIKKSLQDGRQLSKKYGKPICYILDGMSQYSYYDECIENYISEIIDEYKGFGKHKNKFIYSIDLDDNLNMELTQVHLQRNAEYVLYFNALVTNSIETNSKFSVFVECFCKLYTLSEPNIIKNNVKNLRLKNIDLNTLINFKDYLITNEGKCCKTEMYEQLSGNLIDSRLKRQVSEACYELYYNNKKYKDIDKIPYNIFYTVRKQKGLTYYLIAQHYVNQMIDAEKNKPKKIDRNSVLNKCFNYEVSAFISGIIDKRNCQQKLREFERLFYSKLSFEGKSMITYLCGRTKNIDKDLAKLLTKECQEMRKYKIIYSPKDEFFSQVADRSIIISSIAGLDVYEDKEKEYLTKLLSNKTTRKVNREFYLLYYGDRAVCDIDFNNERILEGFDFYNVYHVLSTRLNEWVEKGQDYRLLKIELFTLCDFIQQRIDHHIAFSKSDNKPVNSFFYDKKHNKPNSETANRVLDFTIRVINKYIEKKGGDFEQDILLVYLEQKKREFCDAWDMIKNNALKQDYAFDPVMWLQKCANISNIQKIGWKVEDNITTMNETQYQEYCLNQSYETTLEHTYECYLIGLLYLPETDIDAQYNKQEILNMLLIHDIGECCIGDYPPFYEGIANIKKEETFFNKSLFMSGVHDGIADLTYYLNLWRRWDSSQLTDINIAIAKEIDKIHMIYKLFVLITEKNIRLNKDRVISFLAEKKHINTDHGKRIYDTIINKNSRFKSVIEEYRHND